MKTHNVITIEHQCTLLMLYLYIYIIYNRIVEVTFEINNLLLIKEVICYTK